MTVTPREINESKKDIYVQYFSLLAECYKDYCETWQFLPEMVPNISIGAFNIQKYEKGQHFNKIHTERGVTSLEREFAFMTYLNSVECGGMTEFLHYGLKIKPQKGVTLIWPSAWTHAHKGTTVNKGTKYIITGWMDLC